MAVVVVDQAEFGVVELAGPLYGLLYISVCRYLAVGRVGIGRAEIASGAVHFADVLGEVPAVGEPGAVFLDGQRARGDILRGIPGNEPQAGVSGSGEGGGNTCRIFLRERKAIHRHRLGGDG